MKHESQEQLSLLLTRLSRGDKKAFSQLFDIYSPKVNSFALKLTQSRALAEEIVQDVFMKIWIRRSEAALIQHFDGYLATVVRHHALNVLKRVALEARAKRTIAREAAPAHYNIDEKFHFQEFQQLLKKVIDELPPQQRRVYSLCYGEGLKYDEVAQRLNISRLTVKTHMKQALKSIRAHLTGFVSVFVMLFSS